MQPTEIPLGQAPDFAAETIATPEYGPGGSSTAIFSTAIAAAPAVCLGVILDPSTYPAWNKWIQRVVVETPAPASAMDEAVPVALAQHLTSCVAAADRPGLLLPGAKFCFEVHMDPESASSRNTSLELTRLEEFVRDDGGSSDKKKGIRVVWKTQGDPWHVRAERVQEFVEDGHGGCEYYNYETFHGLLAWAIRPFMAGPLSNGLRLWMEGLKKEAEARAAAQ
ncbi:polyketide cyclase dehydrase [Apiospora kogelbergensis]|uniref:Polyketide cyclase dehydrase n=1 Tax=Apiospora kogelbergensis TaxID=1337665 RepID=A0AAW0RCQ3_9PEZI